MNKRLFDMGWRAGFSAYLSMTSGDTYTIPGNDRTEDYLLGFACGMEAGCAWETGYADGRAGRPVGRPDEAFLTEYLNGYRDGYEMFRWEREHAA